MPHLDVVAQEIVIIPRLSSGSNVAGKRKSEEALPCT